MRAIQRYRFDKKTQEMLERMAIPFAIYQFVEKRVGHCDFSRFLQAVRIY